MPKDQVSCENHIPLASPRCAPGGFSLLGLRDDLYYRVMVYGEPRSRGTARYRKPPLTHEELVGRMRGHGIGIDDEAKALRYLGEIGYYRLSPYVIPFRVLRSSEKVKPGTTFDDILRLYVFDRHLRLLVLDGIERIEVAVRANLTDVMATSTGDSHWYTQLNHFRNQGAQSELLSQLTHRCEAQLRRPAEEPGDDVTYPGALEHYLTHYGQPVLPPSWLMVEMLTIGQLQHMISNLKMRSMRTRIARGLGLNDELLQSWLRAYVRVRNVCAHHGRLWNVGLGVAAKLPKTGGTPWLTDRSSVEKDPLRRRLYPVLVSIQSTLHTINPHSSWGSRLIQLMAEYPEVPLSGLGMFPGWEEDEFWVTSGVAGL